jgi:excinuclease ABC subunit A
MLEPFYKIKQYFCENNPFLNTITNLIFFFRMSENKLLYDKNTIQVSGARVHNLKNISLSIPRDKFIVITGLSGSGKSSLAFDTIYAEGQRRYVESLSSYARQFLGRMNKPEVDFIKGLPPAIAIEQRVNTRNPRSTVGTSTEIYDYLKLLFARIAQTYSPVSGNVVKKEAVTDVVDYIGSFPENTRLQIMYPLNNNGNLSFAQKLEDLKHQGISRLDINGETLKLEEAIIQYTPAKKDKLNVIIDRIVVANDEDSKSRYADSVQMAFRSGEGYCLVRNADQAKIQRIFSDKFEADGMQFEEPSIHMFNFNNPVGACPKCEGYGKVIGIDEELVIPNKNLSIYDDAVVCWKGEKMTKWKEKLIYNADKFNFPIHRPYFELTEEQRNTVWNGNTFMDYTRFLIISNPKNIKYNTG